MTQIPEIPENQIHHLKESLEEDSSRKKIPWLLLLAFLILVSMGGLVYVYHYRDLPKCQDESVQILLNESIRSDEALIHQSRTLAFDSFKETSHNDSQRSCTVNLITNQGNYAIAYSVVDDLIQKTWFSRLMGKVEFSVAIEKIEVAQ